MRGRKRLISGGILISFLLFAFIAPWGCGGFKSENERLKEEITDISAENERLKKELNALRDENSKMHIHLAQLNLQIASLQKEIQNLQKDIDKFKSQLRGEEKKTKKS